MTGTRATTSSFLLLRWGFAIFSAWVGLEPQSSSSQLYIASSYWLRWGLGSFLPRLASNPDSPSLSLWSS
jgi:hypothetical protein